MCGASKICPGKVSPFAFELRRDGFGAEIQTVTAGFLLNACHKSLVSTLGKQIAFEK
jgi:hypothetical protein